jgi:hypothetical protein
VTVVLEMTPWVTQVAVPKGKRRRRQLEGNKGYGSGGGGRSNSSAPFMMGSRTPLNGSVYGC